MMLCENLIANEGASWVEAVIKHGNGIDNLLTRDDLFDEVSRGLMEQRISRGFTPSPELLTFLLDGDYLHTLQVVARCFGHDFIEANMLTTGE
jgi:hypothetical protein